VGGWRVTALQAEALTRMLLNGSKGPQGCNGKKDRRRETFCPAAGVLHALQLHVRFLSCPLCTFCALPGASESPASWHLFTGSLVGVMTASTCTGLLACSPIIVTETSFFLLKLVVQCLCRVGTASSAAHHQCAAEWPPAGLPADAKCLRGSRGGAASHLAFRVGVCCVGMGHTRIPLLTLQKRMPL
jgi:hypothetical protein